MKKQISLKWKIGRYLLIFGVFMIAVMFVFQILLLEPMYEQSKIDTVKSVSDTIVNALDEDEDDLDEIIYQNQIQNETCIRYWQSYEGWAKEKPSQVNMNSGCFLYRMKPEEIAEMIAYANASKDGTYLVKANTNLILPTNREEFRNIIYTRIVDGDDDDDEKNIVMVYTGISPVGAALETLRSQLLYIGLILIAGVVILTYILYKQIAKPLAVINQEAKNLPEGRYDCDEKTNRYREAQELNETLVQAAGDIRKADKARRDLIANVSHDLRTPLTMISGYGEMMIDLPEEKTDENIQVIIDESKRLTSLVNDLLDLSKMQENKIVLEKEVFDLTALVEDQMKKYDVYRMQEGFTIETETCDRAMILADPKRIEQVFNNFMTNAINYSGERKHIIVREILNKDSVEIQVQDFGEGIEQKDLANIWERYYKVDKTHVRVANGSGIGLSIVRQILELHGAEYGVTSSPGEGSTFWFRFPLAEQK